MISFHFHHQNKRLRTNKFKNNFINRENKINLKTYEKVKIAKTYIEKKYRMKHILETEKKKGNQITNLNNSTNLY